jgi:hypothetical protein
VSVLSRFVVDDVRARFSRPDGIGSLWGVDRHLPEKQALLSIDSGVYDDKFRLELQRLAERAKTDLQIQKNCLSTIRLIAYGLRRGIDPVGQEALYSMARDRSLMATLWRGAVSRPLQPRVAGSLVEERARIVEAMGAESELPIPEWLKMMTAKAVTTERRTSPESVDGEAV